MVDLPEPEEPTMAVLVLGWMVRFRFVRAGRVGREG